MLELNYMLEQSDLTDIQTFYPTAAEYTFFSSASGTLSRIDDAHKNFSKFMTGHQAVFSEHNTMKQNKRKVRISIHMWKLKTHF